MEIKKKIYKGNSDESILLEWTRSFRCLKTHQVFQTRLKMNTIYKYIYKYEVFHRVLYHHTEKEKNWTPGSRFNIKMSSYQYRDPHVKDKSCLFHRNPHTWKRQIRVIGMNLLRPNILATIHCINQCYCMNQQLDTLRTNITYHYKICRKDHLKKGRQP